MSICSFGGMVSAAAPDESVELGEAGQVPDMEEESDLSSQYPLEKEEVPATEEEETPDTSEETSDIVEAGSPDAAQEEPAETVEVELLDTLEAALSDIEGDDTPADRILDAYIAQNVDPAYIPSVERMDLVNGLIVKNTLMDGKVVEAGDTLDSIMHGIEGDDISQFAKVLGQVQSLVAVYDVNSDSGYYVASANTMKDDAAVRDSAFAIYDNNGSVVEGCYYDRDTGLAYIPKDLYTNETGDFVICRIQLQLMQVISGSLGNAKSEVLSSTVEEDSGEVDVYRSAENIFSLQTTAKVESGLDEDDMIVTVNGVPTEEYAYDPASGEITLDQSSASVQTLSVTTEDPGDVLAASYDIAAYADKGRIEDMKTSRGDVTIELPAWVRVGTGFSGSLPVVYLDSNIGWDHDDIYTYLYDFKDEGAVSDRDCDRLYNWILTSGGHLSDGGDDSQRIVLQHYYLLFKLMFGASGYKNAIHYDTTVLSHYDTDNPTNGDAPSGADAIVDFSALGDMVLNCGHVTEGEYLEWGNSSVLPETPAKRNVFLRCVWMNSEKTEAVFAMLGGNSAFAHPVIGDSYAQAGIGMFKINIHMRSNGFLSLKKSSGDSSLTQGNSNYSLAGAEYTVYTDSACSAVAKDVDKKNAVLTTDKDGTTNVLEMEPATYYVKETKASPGYDPDETVYKVTLTAENTEEVPYVVKSVEQPKYGYIELRKASSLPAVTGGNDCYTLKDAVYGVFRDASCTDRITSVTTDSSGTAKSDKLPLGSYYIKEIKRPGGYLSDDDDAIYGPVEVAAFATSSSNIMTKRVSDAPIFDPGGICLQKIDAETGMPSSLGSADLAGARFTIRFYAGYYSEEEIRMVDPDRVWVIETKESDGNYIAMLNDDYKIPEESDPWYYTDDHTICLPLGTYTIEETAAPAGYLIRGSFTDGKDGTVEAGDLYYTQLKDDGSDRGDGIWLSGGNTYTQSDQVIRGDLSFEKQDGENQSTDLGSVKFALTSLTTGESHIFWTDMNGQYDTSSSWEPHTHNTNAGESYEDGIWFYGCPDESGCDDLTVRDDLGALPYDTYLLEELPCESNEGRALIKTKVTVYRDSVPVHLGTLDNYLSDTPDIGTTLTDSQSGEHLTTVSENGDISLTDTVTYHGLTAGRTYVLKGILMNRETGEALCDANGSEISAVSDPFTAEFPNGMIDMIFEFSADGFTDTETVAFESLYDIEAEALTAEHADITDAGQTVSLRSPTIQTKAGQEEVTAPPTPAPTPTPTHKIKTGDLHTGTWIVVVAAATAFLILSCAARKRRQKN